MNNLEKHGLSQRFINEATIYPEYKIARVISQYKNIYKIVTKDGEMFGEISGKFRHETLKLCNFPTVGDFVMVSYTDINSPAIIHHVLTRKSSFERTAIGTINETQVVAANIDIIFICMSLNNNYNLSRLERYLSVAWDSGAIPVIVLTKKDLCEDISAVILEIENIAMGTDIILTSCFDEKTCYKLLTYLKSGVTGTFIGSSGVGKSTLINTLAGNNILETSEIRRDGKGRHTTTGRELIVLKQGGIVIDTPGMRELGAESVNLSKSFSDIDNLAKQCKFRDCTHTNEPDCAIKKAIQEGKIEQRRLENYLKLKKEAKYDGLSARQIDEEKINLMFGGKGEMKRTRKFLKDRKKY